MAAVRGTPETHQCPPVTAPVHTKQEWKGKLDAPRFFVVKEINKKGREERSGWSVRWISTNQRRRGDGWGWGGCRGARRLDQTIKYLMTLISSCHREE